MTQLLRVHCFNVSRDGFGAGAGQSLERPFGHAEPADLFSWAGATASWANRTEPGGAEGSTTTSPATSRATSVPRSWAATSSDRSAARGRTSTGRAGGATPRRSTPRCSSSPTITARRFTLSDTTFHFLDATPAEALRQAKEAADGKDVRLGGGVATVRQFLDADLVDTMHIAVAPVETRPRRTTLDLPRGPARPVPPRVRAQPAAA